MKGAWSKGVFPPLELSSEQEHQFRGLARGLVRETLAHFDAYERLPSWKRDLSKQHGWKAVKTRENLTVYKERDPPKRVSISSSGAEHRRLAEDDWQMPKLLLGVGSIVGSLDDVMYGVVTPDAEAMLLKAAIVRSSLVDGAVLAQMTSPTPSEPYRFLGVKWFVKGPPATLRGLIWPRDLVFVESTGTIARSNGDRVGYQLLHSVDLEGYGPLPERSLMRGRISSCTIFKEMDHGRRVDMYVRGYVEQHGKLLDSVALKAASTGFLSSWNAVECGHVKKLMWFTENPQEVNWKAEAAARARVPNRRSHTPMPVSPYAGNGQANIRGFHLRSTSVPTNGERCGGTCGRKLEKVSSVGLCSLCQVPMCSKCRVVKKLAYATCELQLERRENVICRSCVAKVRLYPVRRIAQKQARSTPARPARAAATDSRPHAQSHAPQKVTSPMASAEPPAVSRSVSAGCTRPQTSATARPRPRPASSANTHWHVGSNLSPASSKAAAILDRQRLLELQQQQQQQQQQQSESESHGHYAGLRTKPRWFKRHKEPKSTKDARPVLFGDASVLGDCQSSTLSQCSTTVTDTPSTSVSPINPLTLSWGSSTNESEHRARVEEDEEDDWADTPEFTDSQRERQCLWQQMTELRLAVENTYKIAKHTTDNCLGPSFSPVAKSSPE